MAFSKGQQYNKQMPSWAKEHIAQCATGPETKKPSDQFCVECMYWNPAFGGPARYDLDPSIDMEEAPKSAPYVDRGLDNMWITTDFFRECGFWDDLPPGVVDYAIKAASWFVHIKSGRQYPGLTKRFYQPGCSDNRCWDCCEPDVLQLPGPINQIEFVVYNGEIIDGANYVILDDNKVLNVGCEPWPDCQNFCRSPYTQWPPIADGNQQIHIENNHLDFFDQIAAERGILVDTGDLNWIEEYIARNPNEFRAAYRRQPSLSKEYRLVAGTCSLCDSGGCGTTPCPPGAVRLQESGREHLIYTPESDETWRSIWLRYRPEDFFDGSALEHIDKQDWPWWVNKYLDPNYTEEQSLPLPSKGYRDWVNRYLGEPTEQKPTDWVADLGVGPPKIEYKCEAIRHKENSTYAEAIGWTKHLDQHNCSEDPAWGISYYQGFCPPEAGQLAVASLAREIGKYICDPSCVPSNIARIERMGVDIKFLDRRDLLDANKTGLKEVDDFLQTVNPHALQRRAYFRMPGHSHRKVHTRRPGKSC